MEAISVSRYALLSAVPLIRQSNSVSEFHHDFVKNIRSPCKCVVNSELYSYIFLCPRRSDYQIIQEIHPLLCFPLYISFFNTKIVWKLHKSFQFPRSFLRSVHSHAHLSVELTFFRRVSFICFYFLDVKFHT
jgi:hypothetical protein